MYSLYGNMFLDSWNNIYTDNFIEGYKLNFKKFSTRVIDSKDVGYDYGSIMHYPRKIFGKERSKPTIIPKKKPDAAIGQRISLSKPDILQVSKLYGCPKSTGDTDMDTDIDNNSDEIDENEMNTMPSNR